MTDAGTLALIGDLRALPAETPWVEFKENNDDPEMIGKLISVLSNAAREAGEETAYVLWGIRDGDHAVVGTVFDPISAKKGNQPLQIWLAQCLKPDLNFGFETIDLDGTRLVLLTIPAARFAPIAFDRTAYIRIGSATPCLSDHPERERALWMALQPYAWESGVAAQSVSGDDVLERLDYASYFELTDQPLPENRVGIFDKQQADQLIRKDVGDHWNITNLGAILFARNLNDFSSSLARKGVRFVSYADSGRASTVVGSRDEQKGYANGFAGLMDFVDMHMPAREDIAVFRKERPFLPVTAVRELIASALIHQDMTITGTGPLIELFPDRLEITSPGRSLTNPDRFLDSPPRSRNEALASLMRRMDICEEQGTGIGKVLSAVALAQLPPPDFRSYDHAMRVVLFAPRGFADMTMDERLRACYQHAALMYVQGDLMRNKTLRERFGINGQSSGASQISSIITLALKRGLIKPADPAHLRTGYVPFWAQGANI